VRQRRYRFVLGIEARARHAPAIAGRSGDQRVARLKAIRPLAADQLARVLRKLDMHLLQLAITPAVRVLFQIQFQ